METFINPMTGEVVPYTITAVTKTRQELADFLKKVESAKEKCDEVLFELLENEPKQTFASDSMIVKIVQAKRKVFELDKVFDLLGNVRSYQKDGQVVDLYQPKAGAIQEYLQIQSDKGELTEEEVKKFKDSFYEKLSAPYIKVEKR